MSEERLTSVLQGAGLILVGMGKAAVPLIPPILATFASSSPPGGNRIVAMTRRDAPDFIIEANRSWHDVSRSSGLFDADTSEFLVAVDCGDGVVPSWQWARVTLSTKWDIFGVGSAGVLGNGYGVPGFVMLSPDGNVIVRGDTWEAEVGTVVVRDPCRSAPFRQHGEWMASHASISETDRDAISRWLAQCDD